MRRIHGSAVAAAAVMAVCLAPAVRAQESDEDGPGRGVARISLTNGDVSVRRSDSGDWVASSVNAPLVVQDRVATGPASRAEVQFDYANMLRMAAESEIRLSELEYRRYQVQVAGGTITFRVLRDSDAEVEVSTPTVSIRPKKRGAYRITVREDGQTEITVRSGEVEVYTPRGAERLRSGRTMMVRGSASDPEFQLVKAQEEDAWDNWNERRDQALERSHSYQYVHRDIYGADDLDDHGQWVNVPPYGWVWRPYVAYDWAPYRLGRWAWLDWYGWSWVSYDPWGWAPYHYGRWFYSGGWCWWPGARGYSHHYWRPGLVAFFGWGGYSGAHVGIGFGHVGWVPLAPYERFHPWYGSRNYGGYRSGTYIDNSVHITNVNIRNSYRNARVNNGYTALAADDFVNGRGGRYVREESSHLDHASLVRGTLPVTPGRESLRYSDNEVRRAGTPRTADNARFFSRRQPAAVDRVSFEDQRRGMQEISRRAVDRTGGQVAGAGAAGAGGAVARGDNGRIDRSGGARTDSATGEGRGWRRVGEPAGASGERVRTEAGSNSGNWRRLGGGSVDRSAGGAQADPGARRESGTGSVGRSGEGAGRVTGAGRTESSGNWRRFGGGSEDRGASGAQVDRGGSRESVGGGAGRRSGEGAGRQTAPAQTDRPRTESDRGASRESSGAGQRFGQPGSGGGGSVRRDFDAGDSGSGTGISWRRFSEGGESPSGTQPRSERWSGPARSESAPDTGRRDFGRPSWGSSGGGSRINPPIVRERSSPGVSSGGGGDRVSRSDGVARSSGGSTSGGGGGGGTRSGGGGGRGGRSR